MALRAFLDIDIGSAAQYATEMEHYNRAKEFVKTVGSAYGLGSSLEVLNSNLIFFPSIYRFLDLCMK